MSPPPSSFPTWRASPACPTGAARERTADVLRHVGLYEERYRPIGGYSTGMKQRVKLAQALVHDPRLLFLDEPTNGLDPAGRDEMLALIERIGREFGIAVIVASHLLGEIERVATWLVAIDAGRLLRTAPLETFTGQTGQLAGRDGGARRRPRAAPRDARLQRPSRRPNAAGRPARDAEADALAGSTTRCATRPSTAAWRSSGSRQRRHQLEDLFRDGGADDRVA